MKNYSRKYMIGLLAAVLALLLGVLAQASDTAGSITLQLPNALSEGVEMTLYAVADYSADGTFAYRDAFKDCGITLTDDFDATLAQQVASQFAAAVADANVPGQASATAGADGVISFANLPTGYYLLTQTGGTDVLEVQKVVVPVPYMAEGTSDLVYDVVLAPKYEVPEGAAILNKVDDLGEPVGQAQFSLQKKTYVVDNGIMPISLDSGMDAQGAFVWEDYQTGLLTDENGQIAFSDLTLGLYRLIETKAPEGFFLNDAPTYFEITRGGQVQKLNGVYARRSGDVPQVQAVNTPTKLIVNKVDEDGRLLAGAKLVIMDADDVGITDENGLPLYEFTTTQKEDVFRRLPPGEYFLREVQSPVGYVVAPDVPFTISEDPGVENAVTMVDDKEDETIEKLTVTKHLYDVDDDALMAHDGVFYVALFEDEARTVRVSDVLELHFNDSSSSTVEFLNLEPGKPYYVGETDPFGEFLESGETGGSVYAGEYPDGYKVTLTQAHPEGTLEMNNMFLSIPDTGYYIGGELTVTKRVLTAGEESASDGVFYAAIFTDEQLTQREGDVIELNMDGSSMVSVTREVPIGTEPGSTITYYVAETDQDGNVLDPDAITEYTISVDRPQVDLTTTNSTAEVVITNDFVEEETEYEVISEEEYEETETETETTIDEDNPPTSTTTGGAPSSGESQSSTPVKTGDDTPIALYVALLAAALIVIVAVIVWMRKKKK